MIFFISIETDRLKVRYMSGFHLSDTRMKVRYTNDAVFCTVGRKGAVLVESSLGFRSSLLHPIRFFRQTLDEGTDDSLLTLDVRSDNIDSLSASDRKIYVHSAVFE